MRQSNLKKHLQRKRRSARSASGSSVDRSGRQTRLAHKYLYISVTVRNVVIKNKSEMLVRCFNWFLRPIWRSWILLAIHFDCSSIYREYRNNFDQKLQNEGEKLKHLSVHPTSQTSLFGSRVMFVESFSVRVFTVKTLLPPHPPLKSTFEFLFHCGKVRMNFFSRPSMDQTGFSSAPASIGLWTRVEFAGKRAFFFSSVNEIRAIVNSTHVHIWKSRAQKKKNIMNK